MSLGPSIGISPRLEQEMLSVPLEGRLFGASMDAQQKCRRLIRPGAPETGVGFEGSASRCQETRGEGAPNMRWSTVIGATGQRNRYIQRCRTSRSESIARQGFEWKKQTSGAFGSPQDEPTSISSIAWNICSKPGDKIK
jgi:hypothetical protein